MHGEILAFLLCAWGVAHAAKQKTLLVETLTPIDLSLEDYDDELSGLAFSPLDNDQRQHAPPYFEALDFFEEARDDILNHLIIPKTSVLDTENINFIRVYYAIDGLTVHVIEKGWASYHTNYVKLVKTFMKHAKKDLDKAVQEITCSLTEQNEQISRLRKMMENKLTDLCHSNYLMCNAILHLELKDSDPELLQEANLLLALGRAGVNYLRFYAQTLQNLTTKQAYLLLVTGRHSLRNLVYKNSLARQIVFHNDDKCFI